VRQSWFDSSVWFAVVERYCRLIAVLSLLSFCLQIFCVREERRAEENRAVEILDGDTIRLSNGITVRYIGIDTPEEGEPFYLEAKEANERLVKGNTVRLEFDLQARDKYGRMLAYVYVDTLMVNLRLLKEGLANIYPHPPNLRHLQKFCAVQKEAREEHLGVWSLPPLSREPHYLALENSYRFHRPNCSAVKDKPPEELRVYSSREEALDDCLSPCRSCKP
jgi:micrococcal nuclease